MARSNTIQPTRLSLAITEFIAHLQAKRRAQNTISGYQYVLNRALAEWGDLSTDAIDTAHIDQFFTNGGWADSTQNQYLSTLRKFFKWLRDRRYDWPDHDPTVTWDMVRVQRRERLRLPADEFYPLLDACRHPRDRALLAVGMFTFLRGSEIATLRWQDVDFGTSRLHVKHHKTKTEDDLPISSELRDELVAWMNWYREDQGTIRPEWFLTPAKGPDFYVQDPATRRLATDTRRLAHLRPTVKMGKPYEAVKRALKQLGYDTKGEGVHTLRRSSSRARFDVRRTTEGGDMALMETASILGHSDIRQTQKYIGWNLAKESRDESIAGKPMFPQIKPGSGLRLVEGASDGGEA